jgi:glycosyltransferase involved in cell wall biosynthesis
MNVLLITDDMLPGGISRHVTDLANELLKKEISVTVAATDGKFRVRLNKHIRFEKLFLLKDGSFDKNYFGILPSIAHLRSLVKSEHFDIIHSHKRFTHFLIKILNTHSKHITSYHNYFENKKMVSLFGDRTICCSESVRQQVIHLYGGDSHKTMTIYNGINPFKSHSDLQKRRTYDQLGVSPNKKIISSVGQYIPAKDRKTLILSISKVREQSDVSQLAVVLQGYGSQEDSLRKLVNKLHLEEVITFVDGMFDVEALFNISEFMILNPLYSEGFGIVMLEAASIGKMHIGTRVGGIPDFIEDGVTGKLVDPGNPEQLANAIMYLLNNPNEYQRMGLNAKKKYEKEFSLDRMVNETIAVYRSLLFKR